MWLNLQDLWARHQNKDIQKLLGLSHRCTAYSMRVTVVYLIDAASAGFVVRSAAARSDAAYWGAEHLVYWEAVAGAGVAAVVVVAAAVNWAGVVESVVKLSCASLA